MRTKTNNIYKNILLNNYDVIVFTETWLNIDVLNSEFIDSRYQVYRRDRTHSEFYSKVDGGGLLIAVRKEIMSRRMADSESSCDDLWVEVELIDGKIVKKIGICAVYTVCSSSPMKLKELNTFLDNTSEVACLLDDIIVIGDFNMRFLTWSKAQNADCMVANNYNSELGYALHDFIAITGLNQKNSVLNSENRMLDLVLTNLSCKVSQSSCLISKLDPRHPPLSISLDLKTYNFLDSVPRSDYNFYKANYLDIVSELKKVDWYERLNCCEGVDEAVEMFYNILHNTIERFVPKRKQRNQAYPTWFTYDLIRLLKEKDKLRVRVRKHNNPRDRLELDIVRKRCKMLLSTCYRNYIDNTESNIKKNPKAFWTFIKQRKSSSRSAIPSMLHSEETGAAGTGQEVVDLFASHFGSIYNDNTRGDLNNSYMVESPHYTNKIGLIQFRESDVLKVLKKLNPNKGAGPDNIPPLFVKRCAEVLSYPLTLIFNYSLRSGCFPTIWKRARIVPVFKKGDISYVKNYRPVSILSTFSKVFESLVCPILTNHTKTVITQDQHGFQEKKSVATNLLSYVTPIMSEVDCNRQVDAVYTDFSSAFDKVHHSILLDKLRTQYGICASLLSWFRSYLANREQSVVVNGYESSPYIASSGVPQGSHLGPILFILFINDITQCIRNCNCSLFADDMKLSRVIVSADDQLLLQEDLDRVSQWCLSNNMVLNIGKCQHITFTKKRKPIPTHYYINGEEIALVSEVRDLGITLDAKLSFIPQYNNMILKASKMLGFIKRNTKDFRNPSTKILLFNALVRSRLEFCSAIWNPVYVVHSTRIESIQRSFSRHLAFTSSGISSRCSYDERLSFFHLKPLAQRRRMLDLITFQKIVQGISMCPKLLDQIKINVPMMNSRRRYKKDYFSVPPCKTRLGKHAPMSRFILTFNNWHKICDLDIFHDTPKMMKNKILQN